MHFCYFFCCVYYVVFIYRELPLFIPAQNPQICGKYSGGGFMIKSKIYMTLKSVFLYVCDLQYLSVVVYEYIL